MHIFLEGKKDQVKVSSEQAFSASWFHSKGKPPPPSNDALWLFMLYLSWFSTLMIISKLLLIIVILVLCGTLQAKCFKIQCINTAVTTTDNLYHACKSFPRLGKEEIPKLLQRAEFRVSLVWIFWSAEKINVLCLHRTKPELLMHELAPRTTQSHGLGSWRTTTAPR